MTVKHAFLLFWACSFAARSANFPLEALQLSGTTERTETVLELTGLRIGSPVDKTAMDAACERLQQTGPKHGYVLTLILVDQPKLVPAALDVEQAEAEQTWTWLMATYPRLDHRVPANDAAQRFIAREMERHLGNALEGQHLTTKLEADLNTGRTLVAFQPEVLPAIRELTFAGLHTVSAQELIPALRTALGTEGYTPRFFRTCLESSLTRAFEHHGLYKFRFADVRVEKAGPSTVNITTTVEEGPAFTLGDVRMLGDGLPEDAMRKAAEFKSGRIADWTQIQLGIYQSEGPLRRTGYFRARSKFERKFHADTHVLDVDITYDRGPLFHFGNILFTGLAPADEARARKAWRRAPGDPYDFAYPSEFLGEFSRTLDGRVYKSFNEKAKPGAGDHVMDIEMIFIRR
jgi:hypothetical protein